MERMEDEHLVKKVMKARVDGRGMRGRPRFGWMDGVRRALNERGVSVEEAKECARDRSEWRVFVTRR